MRLLTITAVLIAFADICLAGSIEPVFPIAAPSDIETQIVVNSSWDGFYFGGSVGSTLGEQTYLSSGVPSDGPWDIEGNSFGIFAGYNLQAGGLIYGAEAAYSLGDISSATPTGTSAEYSSIFDVKARAGYAVGDALLYGVVGGSLGNWDDRTGAPETAASTGVNYGLGLDYQITDQFFLGAEYLVRDLSGDFDAPSDVSIDTLSQSAQIRLGMRF